MMSDELKSTEQRRNLTPVPRDEARATVPAGRSLRMLIVDANAETADSLSRFVAHSGHDARWTCDSASALKIALVQIPQVVLLAIDIQAMDGYQLARQLRCDTRLKSCFLIAMRNKTDDWGRPQYDEADFDCFSPSRSISRCSNRCCLGRQTPG